jgi:hypothetical protein
MDSVNALGDGADAVVLRVYATTYTTRMSGSSPNSRPIFEHEGVGRGWSCRVGREAHHAGRSAQLPSCFERVRESIYPLLLLPPPSPIRCGNALPHPDAQLSLHRDGSLWWLRCCEAYIVFRCYSYVLLPLLGTQVDDCPSDWTLESSRLAMTMVVR